MKKIITLSILSIIYMTTINAQRGDHDNDRNDDVYGQNPNYGNNGQNYGYGQQGYGNNSQNNQGYGNNNPNNGYGNNGPIYVYGNNGQNPNNPYNNPNYYPNNGNCGNPPPPCYNPPRPIVVVPPTYCSPIVIAPRPFYGYSPYFNNRYRRHYGHHSRGYGRRW